MQGVKTSRIQWRFNSIKVYFIGPSRTSILDLSSSCGMVTSMPLNWEYQCTGRRVSVCGAGGGGGGGCGVSVWS